MKIVFSRKGFDSGSGGKPSPIIDGRPISLPIPTDKRSETTYADLGLADVVKTVTKGRIIGQNLCHHDPMFEANRCAFGQTAAAQGHLAKHGVGVGDVFLFFGLFANLDGSDRHHRFFGHMTVETIKALGKQATALDQPAGFTRRHPHTLGVWNENNTLYLGRGQVTRTADEALRLSRPNKPVSCWRVPPWLCSVGLTYHARPDRWDGLDTLNVVARGQEFVCDVGDRDDAHRWLNQILTVLGSG